MSPKREDPPSNLTSLNMRIGNLATAMGRPVARIRRVVANTVVGQMLPPGVVKGGTAMMLRVGEGGSRNTADLDVTRAHSTALDAYLSDLDDRLAEGWGGFTGTVSDLEPSHPEGVPDEYVMRPFKISLTFKSGHWLSLQFEVGHDEVGSTSAWEHRLPGDLIEIFETLGLDTPSPIPVMTVEHQVAQKLHACTSRDRNGTNDRAHDLVDLQILDEEETPDLAAVAAVSERLFTSRRSQIWPPTIVTHEGWGSKYAAAAEGLSVIADIEDAVLWANDLVFRITRAAARVG
jgi:hypothetical protein